MHLLARGHRVSTLRENGKTTDDPKERAYILNRQFESVFIQEEHIPSDLLSNTSPYPDMKDIQFTEPGVLKMLERLKPHKAMGADEVGPRVLKELLSTIAPILTVIYRRSYNTGEVPEDWRKANVVAVYKKGRKCEPSNYRPISLTCACCKILEHIEVASSVMHHARDHNILYKLQHRFQNMRSCETQLFGFQADILRSMADGKQTDAIILDFSKTFDKVSHRKLVTKMKFDCVQGRTNTWIQSFLADRSHIIVLEGAQS